MLCAHTRFHFAFSHHCSPPSSLHSLSLLFLILLFPGAQVHTKLMLDPNFHSDLSAALVLPHTRELGQCSPRWVPFSEQRWKCLCNQQN